MPGGKTGILLLQMGGPATLADIRPFLFELFSDPALVPLPGPRPLRRLLASVIASRRSRHVADRYRLIGGGSPLVRITTEQATALERLLAERGKQASVRAVMRYCPPRAAATVAELKTSGVGRWLALSLYPHYSRTTTGSSLAELGQVLAEAGEPSPASIDRWGDDPRYVALLAARVRAEADDLAREAGGEVRVIFSAHGLPEKVILAGDPYRAEIEQTAALVGAAVEAPWRLSFQSRLGPVKWIGPTTGEAIAEAARDNVSGLVMVPLSFVSDHIETLWDLDRVYREEAARAGIAGYRRLAAFNTDPAFIELLADLVEPLLDNR